MPGSGNSLCNDNPGRTATVRSRGMEDPGVHEYDIAGFPVNSTAFTETPSNSTAFRR